MDDSKHWLTLYHAPSFGCRTALACIERFGGAAKVCAATRAELLACGLKNDTIDFIQAPNPETLEKDLRWLEQDEHYLLTHGNSAYPANLREINDPPLLLFGAGDMSLLHRPQIAIVGSRRPTTSGLRNARSFCKALADFGFVVTSGLAVGIDACAHQTVTAINAPTVAVIGTGMNIIYPAANRELSRRIKEDGAIVSEFAYDTPAYAENFPRRNRLMSGLSVGVLVVEAAEKSGSLITARLAAEQGREVFAIPGSIHNPLSRGCHYLIQNGAKLVQTVDDMLVELAHSIALPASAAGPKTGDDAPKQPAAGQLNAEQQRVLEHMVHDEPTTIDQLVEASGLPVATVAAILPTLELEGYVDAENHTYVRLI